MPCHFYLLQLGLLAVDAVFDTHGIDGEVTARYGCIGVIRMLCQASNQSSNILTWAGRPQVTAAGYSYYCTLLPSLWRWPQLLRVALAFVVTVRFLRARRRPPGELSACNAPELPRVPSCPQGPTLLISAWLSVTEDVLQQRRCHIATILLLGAIIAS